MEATQIEDQVERPIDASLSQASDVGSAQVDVETSSLGFAPRAVHREPSEVDSSHGPAVRRHVDAAVAGAAARVEGTARGELEFALDHLDQLRGRSGVVPGREPHTVGHLEEQPTREPTHQSRCCHSFGGGGVASRRYGGVTDKVEGFFRLCAARGLTGEQGAPSPAAITDRSTCRLLNDLWPCRSRYRGAKVNPNTGDRRSTDAELVVGGGGSGARGGWCCRLEALGDPGGGYQLTSLLLRRRDLNP